MNVIERAMELRKQIESIAETMTDENALSYMELYPKWNPYGIEMKKGNRVRYLGVLYRILQDHISQPDWAPDVSPSLFAEVLIPDPEVIAAWKQPESTNPYMKGNKVTHLGKTWISTVDYNVWEPGVSGWEECDE